MSNRVLAHTGAKYPIIQAPMGWIARFPLASAVSRAGGLGIIETSSGETENCKAEITKMAASGLPFGVNLPILFLRDDAMLRFVCESGVKFVTTSAGSPAKFIGPLKDAGIVVYHAVPTVDAAVKCVEAGVDGLVVEGAEGGGFKNPEEVSTLVLLQAIRAKVDVPLVAAGGICDGCGMAAAFALGVGDDFAAGGALVPADFGTAGFALAAGVRFLETSQAWMSAITWSVPGSSRIQWALSGYSR